MKLSGCRFSYDFSKAKTILVNEVIITGVGLGLTLTNLREIAVHIDFGVFPIFYMLFSPPRRAGCNTKNFPQE